MTLKGNTLNAIKWTSVSSALISMLQLVQYAILARFLDSNSFGLMALATVVIGFSQSFLDMGISSAIIHKQEISKDQLSTLYWLNILSGIIIFLVIFLCAPLISLFYNQTELTLIIRLVSITFIILPFGQQFNILWQKQLKFQRLASIDVKNKLVGFAISIVLAFFGFGIYALVLATIASAVMQTAQLLWFGLKEYKPSFRFKLCEVKEFFTFGLFQLGDKTLNYFNYQIDTILIGKLLGVEILGVYAIAKQLVMKPAQVFNPIVTKVTFPAMAKIQNDDGKLRRAYLTTINYLSSVNFPVYLFLFLFSNEIVTFMFGEEWISAGEIVKVLSVWAAIRSTGNPVGSLLLAKGKANWGFYWSLGLIFVVPAGIYIGSLQGVMGICIALVLIQIIGSLLNWKYIVNKLCGAGFIEFFKSILIQISVSILAGIIAIAVLFFVENIYARMMIGISVIGIVSIALNWLFNKQLIFDIKKMLFK